MDSRAHSNRLTAKLAHLPTHPHTHSLDPLHTHTHSRTSCMTQRLQRYEINAPVSWVATPESSFEGLESFGTEHPNVKVTGAGTLRLDYGREVR